MVSFNFPELDERLKVRALWALALALAAIGVPQIWTLINFQPLGIDFLPLWTAGRMSWAHPDRVYDFSPRLATAQGCLLPNLESQRPYIYPPTTLLLLAPFGCLPFWPALAAWVALGLGVFLYAGAPWRARTGAGPRAPAKWPRRRCSPTWSGSRCCWWPG